MSVSICPLQVYCGVRRGPEVTSYFWHERTKCGPNVTAHLTSGPSIVSACGWAEAAILTMNQHYQYRPKETYTQLLIRAMFGQYIQCYLSLDPLNRQRSGLHIPTDS